MGSAEALFSETSRNSDGKRTVLAQELLHAGERLNRVVENLLDMTRLESGALGLKAEWHVLQDLIGVFVHREEHR